MFRDFIGEVARSLMTNDLEVTKDRYFALAEAIREQNLPVTAISQTVRPRESTLKSRVKLQKLLEEHPTRWKFGERIAVYEHESGGYAFSEDYTGDANVGALLDRLSDVMERFREAVNDDAVFDAMFPPITPRTDMDAARNLKPVQQLGLF